MILLMCCTHFVSKFGKLSSGHRTGKGQFHSNPKERQCQRMFKLLQTALISHASKVMLKIVQAGLQQYVSRELPDVQAGFRKGRGTRDQIANIRWMIERARVVTDHIYLLSDGQIEHLKQVQKWWQK